MSKLIPSPALLACAISTFEQAPLPDPLSRLAVRTLVARTSRALANTPADATREFAARMRTMPIAVHTDAANAQHYEVPAEFFALVLGPQRKYSCCLYPLSTTTLAEAEEAALRETGCRAGLSDGQAILELGCGWGALSLWMARSFPKARILAVSNSRSQRDYIEGRARQLGLGNLNIVTADANAFDTPGTFDRVVSIEMFEHMSNWNALFANVRRWLKPDGRFFMHVFTHPRAPYRFDHADRSDWIAQHFFTGGIMPSEALAGMFPELFAVESKWRWSGRHYERTANDWLANFDANTIRIAEILAPVYGLQTRLWMRRWRLFFLATAGLFGHARGGEWGVSHYLLRPVA